jgi:hypothetical protein
VRLSFSVRRVLILRTRFERRFLGVWDAIRINMAALIVQSNYVMPHERFFGNYDLKHRKSWSNAVADINRRIVLSARERNNLLVNDMDGLASWARRRTWFDERFWDLASLFAQSNISRPWHKILRILCWRRGRTVEMRCPGSG